MTPFARSLVLAALVLLSCADRGMTADPPPRRPNVVLVVTDDQRYDTLGCTGHPVARTPNIDRLAREGMLFRRFYVATPLCSPSRASYLTGQYAHRHGVTNNDRLGLDAIGHALMTFPRILRESGYETAFVGKWHMGLDDSRRPGFDRWFSFKGQGAYVDGVANDDGVPRQLDGNMTDHINRTALEWLRRPRTRPFVLIVSHKAVHAPYIPTPKYDRAYSDFTFERPEVGEGDLAGKPAMTRRLPRRPKSYEMEGIAPEPAEPRRGRGTDPTSLVRDQLRCLSGVDEGLGQLLDALKDSGELDRTLVMYTSDNGYLMGEHDQMDTKRWAYEESVRVPFLVRYPPLIEAGTTCDRLTVNVDISPTVLELAGAGPLTPIHGRSLVPLLRDPAAPWRSAILTEYFVEKVAAQVPAWQAVRTDRWKYIHYTEDDAWDELYDLDADPGEERNLAREPSSAGSRSALRRQLEALLDESK